MKHVMRLHDAPYNMIGSGRKTIELRLYDEKRRSVCVGDEIEFLHSEKKGEALICRVIALHVFSSFAELYSVLPLLKCGYTEDDVFSASPADMELYYSKQQQEECGVVGIEIELIG